jgi:AAA15 family ATPase/GTPase
MILTTFKYAEFEGFPISWSLDGLILENINLLVGKNATGKTNTLSRIAWLGDMLAGRKPQLLISGNYDVEFKDDGDVKYHYKLNLSMQKIEHEELIIEDDTKFLRGSDGKGQISTAQFEEKMNFQLSPNQLVVTSKRDAIQHPFLEELVKWAEGQRLYAFSTNMGNDTVYSIYDPNNADPRDINSAVGLYSEGEREFPDEFKKNIIKSMEKIGYELSDIGVTPIPGVSPLIAVTDNTRGLILHIKEKNSNVQIPHPCMSQGMFRALSLIIQITYNTLKHLSTTILIDDIGEGLDFERSSSIIGLIMMLAEEGKVQVIMSTNDRFVMNNVPLKYWQIIQRNGGVCKIFNYHNSQEKFDKFQYMGLNNFDFLATDFINSK